ncbi:MAG: hypothetical protein LBB18_02700 [Puniceicoccales bacterium]|jgi:hypothetical protein|nr:hypothetical protein [Puniceicoccales bacterium]
MSDILAGVGYGGEPCGISDSPAVFLPAEESVCDNGGESAEVNGHSVSNADAPVVAVPSDQVPERELGERSASPMQRDFEDTGSTGEAPTEGGQQAGTPAQQSETPVSQSSTPVQTASAPIPQPTPEQQIGEVESLAIQIPAIGKQLGSLSAFLDESDRVLVSMPNSGNNDGIRAILSQIQERHSNDDIDRERTAIGVQAQGPFSTANMQMVSDYHRRAMVVIERSGENVDRYEFSIPRAKDLVCISDETPVDLSSNFLSWLGDYIAEKNANGASSSDASGGLVGVMGAYLPRGFDVGGATIKQVMVELQKNTKTVLLVKGNNRFMAGKSIAKK